MMVAESNGNAVEMQQLQPQPVVSIRATVQIAALSEAQDERMLALRDYLQQRGVRPAGPPFVRYHTFGATETDLELGVPVAASLGGEGRIISDELPGGPVITTWHLGAHDTLQTAYARLEAWLQAQRREPDGAAWEVYYWIDISQYHGPATWPAPATWRTQLIQPIKES